MNDDPTAASDTARLPPARDDIGIDDDNNVDNDSDAGSQDEAELQGQLYSGEGGASHQQSQSQSQSDRRARRLRNAKRRAASQVRRAKAGIAKKLEFFTHLMSSLDVVVFAELCTLYYMEYVSHFLRHFALSIAGGLIHADSQPSQSCSFSRLAFRSFVQYMYLTPKPEDFLKLMPAPRPQMYTVFGSNTICMLAHLLLALPEAGETMRGYLHGGAIIDFIGQKAPTSRLSLLLLDCMVLALQCVMCAVWLEKDRLKTIEATLKKVATGGGLPKSATATEPVSTSAMDLVTGARTSAQDLDSEERGLLRDGPHPPNGTNETNDIEMQPLVREPNETAGDVEDDGASRILEARYQRILRNMSGSHSRDGSLLDVMVSGNGVLANLHVVHSIRTLIADNANDPVAAAGYPIQLTGYGARIAALAAESQARLDRRARQQP